MLEAPRTRLGPWIRRAAAVVLAASTSTLAASAAAASGLDPVEPTPEDTVFAGPIGVAPLTPAPITDGRALTWNGLPDASRVEYGAMLGLAVGTVLFQFVPVKDRHWGGDGFDYAIRDALVLHSADARKTARTVSDLLWYSSMAYPVVIDALLVAGPKDSHVAWQLLILDGEALAMGAFLTQAAERTTGRARPFIRGCRENPNYGDECAEGVGEAYQSFMSGHTLMSFTGAGLTCANHLHLPLYGGGAGDVIACIGATTAAATEGTLRVMADRHWATDVMVGGVLGFATGYGIPLALRYRRALQLHDHAAFIPLVIPYATTTQAGAIAVGSF